MAQVDLYSMNGSKTGTMELDDSIFAVEINEHVLHMAVVAFLANQRQGTKAGKTRSEVSGGGTVFAAKPRNFSIKLNKKVKRLAMKCALTSKLNDNKIIVLDDLSFSGIKTKEMQTVLNNLKTPRALVVIDGNDKNVILSARNIEGIKTACVSTINPYDILKFDTFVVTKAAIEKIQEVYA
ncbi:MAG: 50S ribosomal protein L4 [Clostridiales bacterium]|jgi:large subunit ribosomal protein L4|nr:50S ribosomal protein L4 [Clostridiales bacterium]